MVWYARFKSVAIIVKSSPRLVWLVNRLTESKQIVVTLCC
jgi:hypothetical protein